MTLLAGCASRVPEASVGSSGTKEYFAESEYGVKASPRVSAKRSRLQRGGGVDKVGKPYKVKGRWYYPKEDPDYDKKGLASWYGAAFHGRLTANGEIYDMTHLTAAHPTMPLPSYARVTNLENGSSVIVRVNDRGPYASNRVIDLSKRAAEMLDYTHDGIAKVRVQYVGRAPLDGDDDAYLMASYQPGPNEPALPGSSSNVMVAMAGPAVTGSQLPAPFPSAVTRAYGAPAIAADMISEDDPILPDFGPVPPEKPGIGLAAATGGGSAALLGYADYRVRSAASAFDAMLTPAQDGLTASKILRSWRQSNIAAPGSEMYAGAFPARDEAEMMAARLAPFGRTIIETEATAGSGEPLNIVLLRLDDPENGNTALKTAWAAGAGDAFLIHD